ncbi:MAG: Gfo/Idh/MocA family protein [Caldilineaceae bacterium]
MADSIRWGLLSTAKINNALITPIRQSARSELVAVASRSESTARAYANENGIPKAVAGYEALLEDPEIDVVYIPLPNSMHAEWTVRAAEAGKHVLVEKPASVTLDGLNQMAAAAKANDVTVFEAFMYLHHPQTQLAKEMIDAGRLGKIQTVTSWFHFYLPPENSTNIRLSTDLVGGGLWDVGVYPNSLAIYMIGDGTPTEVWAQQIVGESGVDVAMRSQLRFNNGAVAQLSSGLRSPFREGAHIVGEFGSLVIPQPWKPGETGSDSVMIFSTHDGRSEEIETPAISPYLCEVQAMEACILDGAEPVVSLELSQQFLLSALAQYESARSGTVVTLR